MTEGNRLLFIDFIRIVAILLVIIQHMTTPQLFQNLNSIYFIYNPLPPFIWLDYGTIGVILFIFTSGLSLGVSGYSFENLRSVLDFLKRRLFRIYPIYWVAILFSLVLFNYYIPTLQPMDYVNTVFGIQAFFQTTMERIWAINGTFWFVGVIVCLYFMFPLISIAMKRHRNLTLIFAFFVSIASRTIMYYVFPQFISGWDWFPLCHLSEFVLGIYITQTHSYPQFKSNKPIIFLANLSFYVYLVHFPILFSTNYEGVGIVLFIVSTIVFSLMFYSFDKAIQDSFRTWRKLVF